MTQEKIIHFVTATGEQIAVIHVPSFQSLQDEINYYQIHFAKPEIIQLYATAHYKMEFLKSNPFFEQMEKLWLVSETDKLCIAYKFSALETKIMHYIMEGKSVKQIAGLCGHISSTTGNCVSRMSVKIGMVGKTSAQKLKQLFLVKIYA